MSLPRLALPLLFSVTAHAAAPAPAGGWTDLLDAKLTKWELYMGIPHASVQGLPPGTPTSADIKKGTPLGLNNDPKKVFSMRTDSGEPVLYITGEIYGGLTTLAEHENYHLRLETKWGQKIWEPRPTKPRDSGLLIHCVGKHGAFWNVWMACLEYQIQENDLGDLFLLGGTSALVPSAPKGKFHAFSPGSPLVAAGARPDSKSGMVQRFENFERAGEWNVVEVYTVGDTAVFLVNGKVVNALAGAQIKQDGGLVRLARGKLQLQSEAAEVYFRRIQLRPIAAIPAEILKASGLPTP